MKALRAIYLTALAAGLLLSGSVRAQGLPELAKASEITTGTLPDGVSYYLVSNPNTPGFADFALVQPSRPDRRSARQDLVDLPHFINRKPYEFLGAHSIGYSPAGHIRHMRDAAVFRFENVPVSQSEVTDSMFLMMFDIARSSQFEQALVVSGDIDVANIIQRVRILSMTLSQREKPQDEWSYHWRQQDKAAITAATTPVGTIHLRYRSPRTDRELMNTIQPVMSRIFATEMDLILERRIRAAFAQAGIPLADYRFRYTGSDATAGDEAVSISVYTAPERLQDALGTLAGVLSGLDEDGATQEEVTFARSVVTNSAARELGYHRMTNAMYLDKCIGSYLFGGNLASYATLCAPFANKHLDISRERELLNRYIAAMLAPQRNLQLMAGAPVAPDRETVANAFAEGWKNGSSVAGDVPVPEDTLRLMSPRKKVKLKNTAADAFTGGKMWTFSNGISVVYKKTDTKGMFHYGFLVKGGLSEIPGIKGSEASFASEVLPLCSVAGMSGQHLADMLAMYGVTIKSDLSLSDVRISGSAPSTSLSLVLKTMLSTAGSTEADPEAYARYREAKAVRLVREKFADSGTRAVLDSLMCPDYRFAAGSMPELPSDDFPVRLSQYVQQKGSTTKNGLIVLIGDLDENATLKMLTHCLGDFRTGQQRVVRPRYDFPLRSCWNTVSTPGGWRDKGVSVSLSTLAPFGAEGNTKLQLACVALESELAKIMAPKGVHCNVSAFTYLLPAERMTIYIQCAACPEPGLPANVAPVTPPEMLQAVRKAVNKLAVNGLSKEELAIYKTMLTDINKAGDKSQKALMDAVLNRAALGRDMRSGYKERIKAVKASEIKDLFAALSDCTCEYVVQ